MLHGGTTPMQALRFGAQMAAELLGIGDEVETLEQGKSADLVVVAGDPLEDIGALREVRVGDARRGRGSYAGLGGSLDQGALSSRQMAGRTLAG